MYHNTVDNFFVYDVSRCTGKQRLTWQEPLLNDVQMKYIRRLLGLKHLTV